MSIIIIIIIKAIIEAVAINNEQWQHIIGLYRWQAHQISINQSNMSKMQRQLLAEESPAAASGLAVLR